MSSFPVTAAGKIRYLLWSSDVLNIKDNREADLESDKSLTMFSQFLFLLFAVSV